MSDLTGQWFDWLLVVGRVENTRGAGIWLCLCRCGNRRTLRAYRLITGTITTCGCGGNRGGRNLKSSEEISYAAAHMRIRRARGRATDHMCIDCGEPARDWCLRRDASPVLTTVHRGFLCRYSGDPADYDPRCRWCHRAYDRTVARTDEPDSRS